VTTPSSAASAGLATLRKYEYGHQLLCISAGSGTSRTRDSFVTDGLASTANLITEAGSLRHSYRYDSWGRIRSEQGASDNPRQFTGHYRDEETGLHYFGARYYDEEQGRFLSQDGYMGQAMSPPSLHRYLYANANPLTYVDQDGHSATAVGAVAGFFWGAIQMGGAMASDLSFKGMKVVMSPANHTYLDQKYDFGPNVNVPPTLATQILNSPDDYYFNVHTTLNTGGAARGQLVKQ